MAYLGASGWAPTMMGDNVPVGQNGLLPPGYGGWAPTQQGAQAQQQPASSGTLNLNGGGLWNSADAIPNDFGTIGGLGQQVAGGNGQNDPFNVLGGNNKPNPAAQPNAKPVAGPNVAAIWANRNNNANPNYGSPGGIYDAVNPAAAAGIGGYSNAFSYSPINWGGAGGGQTPAQLAAITGQYAAQQNAAAQIAAANAGANASMYGAHQGLLGTQSTNQASMTNTAGTNAANQNIAGIGANAAIQQALYGMQGQVGAANAAAGGQVGAAQYGAQGQIGAAQAAANAQQNVAQTQAGSANYLGQLNQATQLGLGGLNLQGIQTQAADQLAGQLGTAQYGLQGTEATANSQLAQAIAAAQAQQNVASTQANSANYLGQLNQGTQLGLGGMNLQGTALTANDQLAAQLAQAQAGLQGTTVQSQNALQAAQAQAAAQVGAAQASASPSQTNANTLAALLGHGSSAGGLFGSLGLGGTAAGGGASNMLAKPMAPAGSAGNPSAATGMGNSGSLVPGIAAGQLSGGIGFGGTPGSSNGTPIPQYHPADSQNTLQNFNQLMALSQQGNATNANNMVQALGSNGFNNTSSAGGGFGMNTGGSITGGEGNTLNQQALQQGMQNTLESQNLSNQLNNQYGLDYSQLGLGQQNIQNSQLLQLLGIQSGALGNLVGALG